MLFRSDATVARTLRLGDRGHPVLPALVPRLVQRLGPLLASLGDAPEAEWQGGPQTPPLQRTRFCVTGPAEAFATAATTWLGSRPRVQRVDLRSPARAF